MTIPKIPNNINNHISSSAFKNTRQFMNNTGRKIKANIPLAAIAHPCKLGLPRKIIHQATAKTIE
jgi:hypothetical protein